MSGMGSPSDIQFHTPEIATGSMSVPSHRAALTMESAFLVPSTNTPVVFVSSTRWRVLGCTSRTLPEPP